jgi:hypothetical protein
MQPATVVENLQILKYYGFSLLPSCKAVTVATFHFQTPEEAFAQGVVPAISLATYGKFNPVV